MRMAWYQRCDLGKKNKRKERKKGMATETIGTTAVCSICWWAPQTLLVLAFRIIFPWTIYYIPSFSHGRQCGRSLSRNRFQHACILRPCTTTRRIDEKFSISSLASGELRSQTKTIYIMFCSEFHCIYMRPYPVGCVIVEDSCPPQAPAFFSPHTQQHVQYNLHWRVREIHAFLSGYIPP